MSSIAVTEGSPLAPHTVGVFFNVPIDHAGGTDPLFWSIVSGTPPGLSIDHDTGNLSGTPTTPGNYTVRVRVEDADFHSDEKNLSLTILEDSGALVFSAWDDKIDHGSGASLENLPATGQFSGEAWIYKTDIGGQQCIMTKDIKVPSGWMFLVDGATATGLIRFIIFRGATFGNATDYRSTTLDVPNNVWTFVTFSFNEATTPKVHIYKGNLTTAMAEVSYTYSADGTGSPSNDGAGAGPSPAFAAATLQVGNDGRSVSETPLNFKGRIARVRISDTAKTLAQFEAARKTMSLDLLNESGTLLLADYTDTGSQTDFSGNGNTGTSSAGVTTAGRPPFFAIMTETLPDATVGASYNQAIEIINGVAPIVSATVDVGSLPSGLSIAVDTVSGINVGARITGTATGANGTSNFRINLVDDEGFITTQNLSITKIGGGAGDTTAPTVPTGLTATVQGATAIDLLWNPSTDDTAVTGYDLQRATNSGFTTGLTTINLGNVTTYADTGLSANTKYYYRVRAHDAVPNNSAYSASINRTTLPAWEGTKTFGSGGYQGVCAKGSAVHVSIGQFSVDAIKYWRSPNEGVSWDIDGVTIATGIPYLEDPLVINSDGSKIACFYFKNIVDPPVQDFVGARYVGELYCVISTNGGTNWGSEELVSGVVVPGRGLRMSACWDQDDRLHATWMDFKNVANPTNYSLQTTAWDLYYNRRVSGTWETEQRIFASTNKTGENRPSVVSLNDGSVHLVWFAGLDSKPSCIIDTGTTNLPVCTEIFHSRNPLNGSAGNWAMRTQLTDNSSPVLYSGRTDCIAIEPATLLVTFDRGNPGTPNNDEYSIRSINGGLDWLEEAPIVIASGVQSHSATAYHNGKTSVVWGDRNGSGTLFSKESSNDGEIFGVTELALAGSIVGLIDRSEDYLHLVGFVGSTGTYKRRFVLPPAPDTEPPSDVGTITPTVISSSQINLDWANALDNVGVVDYMLQRSTNNTFTANLVSIDLNSPVSATNVSGLAPATTYYFRVKAKDAAGNYSTNWSPTATATTNASNIVNVGNVTNWAHTGLSSGAFHTYRIRAYDAAGNRSGWSTVVNATTS